MNRAPGGSRRWPGAVLLLGVMLLAASCVRAPHHSVRDVDVLVDDGYAIIPHLHVPEVDRENVCGMQALAAVLHFHDPAEEIADLLRYEPWNPKGATAVEVLQQARLRGYEAELHRGDWEMIASHTAAGMPVLVLYDASVEERLLAMAREGRAGMVPVGRPIPRGEVENLHWAVVGGISGDGSNLAIAIPRNRFFLLEKASFLERWESSANCLVVIRPPEG